MNEQDRLYRLVKELPALLHQCPATERLTDAFAAAPAIGEGYRLHVTRCELKRDWADAIAQSLPFVERALEEERRFLHARQEVVRIDRARGISAESVRHLAQHSNYIAHADDSGEVIPSRLLVAEREDNFAIYENRFLFTLVSVIQNFVEKRFQAMTALNGAASLAFETFRTFQNEDGQAQVSMRLAVPLVKGKPEAPEALCTLRARVNALESAQLIKLLKGTPLVTSPIVRTNVIKKNLNFKHALALYEYLLAYRHEGYDLIVEETPVEHGWCNEAIWSFCALASLQRGVAGIYADKALWLTLERDYQEENLRRQQAQLLLEKEREAAVLARIEAARLKEAALRAQELARCKDEILRLSEALKQLQLSFTHYRESMVQRECALVKRTRQTQERLEAQQRRLEGELRSSTQKWMNEQAAHAACKRKHAKLEMKQKERLEQALKTRDRHWQRELENERESTAQSLRVLDLAHKEEIQRLKQSADERLKQATRRLRGKVEALRRKPGPLQWP